MKGYTVVDAATVLSTHLTELLKSNIAELLSYAEVQKLIKDLPKEQGELVKDIVPAQITRVRHPARAATPAERARLDPRLRDHPRRHRRRAGVHPQSGNHRRARAGRASPARSARSTPRRSGYLPLIALSAKWEQTFAESIVGQGDERSLAMQPSRLSEFITLVRERFEDAAREGEAPVLVTSPRHPAVRARHRRALPRPDQRAVAVRDPPAGPAEDRRQHLTLHGRSVPRTLGPGVPDPGPMATVRWRAQAPDHVRSRDREGALELRPRDLRW